MRRGPIIVLLLVCLLAAGYGALRLERQSWTSLVGYTPPFSEAAAAATGTAPLPALAPRLVLVLADGLSATDVTRLPAVAYLREQGAYGTLYARPTPWPRAAWATVLTGASPQQHGVVMNAQAVRPLSADNLLAAARRSGKSVAAAADATLGDMLRPWLDRGFFAVPAGSTAVAQPLVDWLRLQVKAGGPDLVLVNLPYPHAAAHATGDQRPTADSALTALDATIAQFLDQVDLKTTAIAVVGSLPTDGSGHHATDSASAELPFVLTGAGVSPGSGPSGRLEDVTPTLAILLGTSLPAWSAGEPHWGMLRLRAEEMPERLQRLVAQQRAFYGAYASIYGYQIDLPTPTAEVEPVHSYLQSLQGWAEQARQGSLRAGLLHRLPWVAGAWLLILLYLLVVSRQPYSLSLTLGALGYSALYYIGFFARGGRFSAAMPGLEALGAGLMRQQLWLAVAAMAVSSLYLGWHLGRRGFRRGAYVCLIALHACLVSLGLVAALTLIPVLVQGINFHWFLPDIGLSLLYFFGLQQVMVIGLGSPLWMFLTLVLARLTAVGARPEAEAALDPKVIPLPERRRTLRNGRSRSS